MRRRKGKSAERLPCHKGRGLARRENGDARCFVENKCRAGVYELRLNRNNGAVRVATSAQITVSGTTTGAASVSASSSTVTAGGTLNVSWSGVTSPTTTDWIGIFPIGAADYGYLSYIYTSSGTPSAGATASSAGTASMSFPTTPGVYELRLNRNNGAVRVATSAQITVR